MSYIRLNELDYSDISLDIEGDIDDDANKDARRILWEIVAGASSEIDETVNGSFLEDLAQQYDLGYLPLSNLQVGFPGNVPSAWQVGSVLRIGGPNGEYVQVGVDDTGDKIINRIKGPQVSRPGGTSVELVQFPQWLKSIMRRFVSNREYEKGGRNVRRLEAEDLRLLAPYTKVRF